MQSDFKNIYLALDRLLHQLNTKFFSSLYYRKFRELTDEKAKLLGESQKISVFDTLQNKFPNDYIETLKDNNTMQTIYTNKERSQSVKFIYGSRTSKTWLNSFTEKLKTDQNKFKADHAILATKSFPSDLNGKLSKDGVWICKFSDVAIIAEVLRHLILKIADIKKSEAGGSSSIKSQNLLKFIKSNEYEIQMRTVKDKHNRLKKTLNKEITFMNNRWKEREKDISDVQKTVSEMSDIFLKLKEKSEEVEDEKEENGMVDEGKENSEDEDDEEEVEEEEESSENDNDEDEDEENMSKPTATQVSKKKSAETVSVSSSKKMVKNSKLSSSSITPIRMKRQPSSSEDEYEQRPRKKSITTAAFTKKHKKPMAKKIEQADDLSNSSSDDNEED